MFPLNAKPTFAQNTVLESEPNLIVYGPAGSGKTMLTILLAEKLKKSFPALSVEIIVFTKSLGKFIIKTLTDRGINDVFVRHYININSKYENIDITIIDEGQDFVLSQIKWMINRSEKGVYLMGDTNQDVYEFNKNDIRFEEVNKHLKFKEVFLDEVLRFSPSIDAFIKNIFPNIKNKMPNYLSNDLKPYLFRCKSYDDQIIKIISYLNKIESGTTAILVLRNEEVINVKNHLEMHGLIIDGFKFTTDDQLSTNNNALNVLTYHSAKGLEFDNIILPNLE
jgi:superfamily I DNA/RNA helicase